MKRVLLVGVGGLGSPVALLLARHGGLELTIVDDDVVDRSNLHRQTLYTEADVGQPKIERAARRIEAEAEAAKKTVRVTAIEDRFTPDSAARLLAGVDLVVEGADNLATKFLVADAAHLAGIPAVHAGVVRWAGWALASLPGRSACLRCLFEDLPRDRVETCAEAGVVGPLVGVVGALEASLALRLVLGDDAAAGEVVHVDALRGSMRRARVRPRADCGLCGPAPQIRGIELARYVGPDRGARLDGESALSEHHAR